MDSVRERPVDIEGSAAGPVLVPALDALGTDTAMLSRLLIRFRWTMVALAAAALSLQIATGWLRIGVWQQFDLVDGTVRIEGLAGALWVMWHRTGMLHTETFFYAFPTETTRSVWLIELSDGLPSSWRFAIAFWMVALVPATCAYLGFSTKRRLVSTESCRKCGHQLAGAQTCPECGHPRPAEGASKIGLPTRE